MTMAIKLSTATAATVTMKIHAIGIAIAEPSSAPIAITTPATAIAAAGAAQKAGTAIPSSVSAARQGMTSSRPTASKAPPYGHDGNKLGTIHNFMVEKRGGQVRYAVMKCSSGFLGMDERYYPLDWSELDYDTDREGYRVDMTERDLDHRRSFDSRGRPIRERSDDYQRSGW